jgi:hypothetical protein
MSDHGYVIKVAIDKQPKGRENRRNEESSRVRGIALMCAAGRLRREKAARSGNSASDTESVAAALSRDD